jgi:hypothetical protein
MQYPGVYGNINDLKKYSEKAKSSDLKIVIAADLLSLCLLKEPSVFGADVVVGHLKDLVFLLVMEGLTPLFLQQKKNIKGQSWKNYWCFKRC